MKTNYKYYVYIKIAFLVTSTFDITNCLPLCTLQRNLIYLLRLSFHGKEKL